RCPRRQRPDCRAAPPGDAVRPRRLYPLLLHAGGGQGALRAAVVGRRLLHGDVLFAVQYLRARNVYLAAAALPRRRPPVVPLVLHGPAAGRLRLALGGHPAGPLATAGRLPGRPRPSRRLVVDGAPGVGYG